VLIIFDNMSIAIWSLNDISYLSYCPSGERASNRTVGFDMCENSSAVFGRSGCGLSATLSACRLGDADPCETG
jgi:hypothetical protein